MPSRSDESIWSSVGKACVKELNAVCCHTPVLKPSCLMARAVKEAAPTWRRLKAQRFLGVSIGGRAWSQNVTVGKKLGRPFGSYKDSDQVIKNHLKKNSTESCRLLADGQAVHILTASKTRLGAQLKISKSTFCRRTHEQHYTAKNGS